MSEPCVESMLAEDLGLPCRVCQERNAAWTSRVSAVSVVVQEGLRP